MLLNSFEISKQFPSVPGVLSKKCEFVAMHLEMKM